MNLENVEINKNKYKNSLLYFIKYCNNRYFGATKLNKLLYYLDFISYRDKKQSVTGDLYVNKDFGPVPSLVDDILSELREDKKLKVERVEYGEKGTFVYEALQDPDLSVFNSYEKELLRKICKEFVLWSTDKIVNQTHLEAPWFYSEPYEVVDYEYSKDIEFFQ